MSDVLALEEALARLAAPVVAIDGGTVRLVSLEDGVATVALEGACVGCPVRAMTRDEVLAPIVRATLGDAVTVQLADPLG